MTNQTLPYIRQPAGLYPPVYGSRNLRHDLNVIFAALTIHCCSYLVSWIIDSFLSELLFSLFPSESAYYAVSYTVESLTYALNFLFPAVIIMVFAHISPLRLTELPEGGQTVSGRPKAGFLPAVFVGLCAVETSGIISGRILDMFESAGFNFSIDFSEDLPADIAGIIAYLVSVAVVPGIVEELLFRGCVAGVLKRYNAAFAIIVSSLTFALMHCTVQQFFYAFSAGLVFGWIAVYTGRLWPGILIHILNNSISVGLDYLYALVSRQLYMVIYIAFSTVIMTLGIIGAVILIRRGGRVREGVNEIGLDVAARSLIRPLPIIYLLVITAVTILVLSL